MIGRALLQGGLHQHPPARSVKPHTTSYIHLAAREAFSMATTTTPARCLSILGTAPDLAPERPTDRTEAAVTFRDRQYDMLTEHVRTHMDMDRLLRIAGVGSATAPGEHAGRASRGGGRLDAAPSS